VQSCNRVVFKGKSLIRTNIIIIFNNIIGHTFHFNLFCLGSEKKKKIEQQLKQNLDIRLSQR
jgi:hypothetical protein